MAVLKLGSSRTFASFSALAATPSPGILIFQNPAENTQKTIAFNELVKETKAYSKESLLQLKKEGWNAAIRDKGDGVEIDQLRLSFTESESNQIRLSERYAEVQQIVYDAFNELESFSVQGEKQNGIRWQAVEVHTDTKKIHLDIYRHRHYIDVEDKTISRAYQGSSPSEISKVSDKIKQRLIEAGIFQENGFEMTGVSQFKKEEKESLIQVSEDIKEGGGFGNKIEDARSLILSEEAINSIKNQDFIFNVIAEKQKELNDLKQVLIMSQQAAAALIQRDEAIEAQKLSEAQAEAAQAAQKEAEAVAAEEQEKAAKAALEAQAAQEAQTHAEKERADFENRLLEVSAKSEEIKEENINLKSDLVEIEEENKLLTQENSGLENNIETLEKEKADIQEKLTVITAENTMFKNTIEIERENAALTKSIFENRILEVSAKSEEIKEENINLKSNLIEIKEESKLLTQENSGLENNIETLEKEKADIKEKLTIITSENTMFKNTIEIERENAALTKSMLERIQKDEENQKQVNEQLQKELNSLRESINKIDEDAQALKARNSKLMEKLNKTKHQDNDMVKGNGEGNTKDFIKSNEWRNLEYAGAKYTNDLISFPPNFNDLKEPLKSKMALDIHVASHIRWGDDYKTTSDNKTLVSYMDRIRKENKSLIKARAEGFDKNPDYINMKRAENLLESGVSIDDFAKKNNGVANEIKGVLKTAGYSDEEIEKGVKVNKEEKNFVIVDAQGDYAIFNGGMELEACNDQNKTARIENALSADNQNEQDDGQEV